MPRRFSRTLVILAWAAASVACGAAAAVTAPTPVAPVTGQAANQSPSTIVLTGETLQLYAADPGSAHLSGPGFDLTSASAGSFPQTVAAGSAANFSGSGTLSGWGNVTVNGVALHVD